jgi:small redox-active disulfide protein 2
MEKLEIIVLGPGCANCLRLEKMCRDVVDEENIDARIMKVTDHDEMADYGIILTPGLIINGKVVLSGKMPTLSTLKNWIKTAAKD